MSTTYHLNDLISIVKGIGPASSTKLANLGITNIRDLLHHFPSRYYDFTQPVTINHLASGKTQVFTAILGKANSFYTNTGKLITQVTAKDQTGKISLTWFNNPYIKKLIKENTPYTIAGKVSLWGKGITLIAPMIEPKSASSINTQGLVPIFPQTAGVTSRYLRTKIAEVLSHIDLVDPLEPQTLAKLKLITQNDAYCSIHFPHCSADRWQADKRLSFNEHLKISLNNQIELQALGNSPIVQTNTQITHQTRTKLPFTLTKDQNKTVISIYRDLSQKSFTHRLIQGDTGSGKTATLIFAANQCLSQNLSCAVMAPTEILAQQHFQTFSSYCLFSHQVQLITGSSKTQFDADKPQLFIGTHALITQLPHKLKFPLAFLAIDEQHKFGVKQRDLLLSRTPVPHLFNLSATPIPRTAALGLLGDIKISNIRHQPSNRLPTKTFVVSPSHFKKSPTWLSEKLTEGNQIFVVCPNITEHDASIASIEKIARQYRQIIPDQFPLYQIHGQMKTSKQNEILSHFKKEGRGVLVSTSLIEVGIDIPSANIMIIHSAERFGLAALHQLRGRVGRGDGQGYCFLVPSQDDDTQTERLQLLNQYHSGLILAQKDLRLRGAGEVFGTKQHGSLSTRLKYFWSRKLFLTAKKFAQNLLNADSEIAKKIAIELSTC